ncbi:MAG TPA: helix-turn-helix transcriptional regulator [Gammaproteobacteria bacterium]
MLSKDRRQEIATFLRIRRARVQPEQVGLARGARRRTPGLRREEVAALAGVSTEWYTWLEQARDVHPSAEALQRIAAALRLEPAECRHLLALGGYAHETASTSRAAENALSPQLLRLLRQLDPCPAWVHGERWDMVAWNEGAKVIYGDLDRMRGIERNVLYHLFLNPNSRRALVDWGLHARNCVAKHRLAHARYVDDPWFNELTRLLRERSPEFAAWWDEHNVQLPEDGVKAFDHPHVGRLTFDYTVLALSGERAAGLQMIVYVPAPGTGTREKMERLLERASDAAEEPALAR